MSDFYIKCLECDYELITLTETNLLPGLESSELFDESEFSVYRVDRSAYNSEKGSFGGVLIAVRAKFPSDVVPIPNTDDIECVCVKASMKGVTFYTYCGYIPPDKSNDLSVYSKHVDAITYVQSRSNPDDVVLVSGDFNMPLLKWSVDEDNTQAMYPVFHLQVSKDGNSAGRLSNIETFFCDNVLGNGMYQINTIANDNKKFLDLIFSSTADDVIVTASDQPLVKEDYPHHKALEIHMDLVFENDT